ncbi:hypothetical protein BDQ17DRAFT_1348009 [Cyathus striatus]|nr:hypothetical protein BDQ17DRAFT_1348009 [Cyathus striatus]
MLKLIMTRITSVQLMYMRSQNLRHASAQLHRWRIKACDSHKHFKFQYFTVTRRRYVFSTLVNIHLYMYASTGVGFLLAWLTE